MKFVEIDAPDFDLATTLDSGQVFHWDKIDNGAGGSRATWTGKLARVDEPGGESINGFCGTIGEEPIYIEQGGETLRTSGDANMIRNYFALDHPLGKICASFPNDPVMKAARNYCRGLRIIRQPKWECLATFITSSMKQVAHIRQISRKLRERFGESRKIMLKRSIENAVGGSAAPRAMVIYSAAPTLVNIEQGTARSTNTRIVFTFPPADRIAESSEKELRECALGYRAKNLLATARLVASGDADLAKWAVLSDVDLRAKLCELPGVGAKVANCVMLFAYERLRAFPIDVWIERVLKEKYFPRKRKVTTSHLREFAGTYFGEHGGYAQQYLFHYARMTGRRANGGRRAVGALNQTDTRARVPPSTDKRNIRRQFVTASGVR